MALTWKDGVATVLVGAAAVITYATLNNFNWVGLDSWRIATVSLLALGLGTCIVVGSGVVPEKNNWTILAGVLGVLAFVFALIGIISGTKLAFVSLAILIGALWLLSTTHHLLMKGAKHA